MIVTCASCLTKFNLDDSKIPSKGTKVRCSKCQYVFFIVPPPEAREEVDENLESFAKYHKELFEPGEKEAEDESFESFAKYHKELFMPEKKEEVVEKPEPEVKPPEVLPEPKIEQEFPEFTSPLEFEKEPKAASAEEEAEDQTFLFSEKPSSGKREEAPPSAEEEPEPKAIKPGRKAREERRRPSLFLALIAVFILLIFGGAFYLWTKAGSGGRLSDYVRYPVGKISALWKGVLGTEKKGLTIGDLTGYDEKVGEFSLYVIEGKVNNQSGFTKKLIKVRVGIFDQKKSKVAEKETFCGPIINREELRNLPAESLVGEVVIKPKSEKEMVVPSGQTAPFMVIFKHLSGEAKEFTVEIVEAPNL